MDSSVPDLDAGARADGANVPDGNAGTDAGRDAGDDPVLDGGDVEDGGPGGVDSGGGPVVDAGTPVEMNIGHTAPGCDDFAVAPLAGEEGHSLAVRITPPTYPFTVREVHYSLSNRVEGGFVCDPSLAHRTRLFTGSRTTPPSTPTVLWSTDVDGMATGGANRDVVLDVTPPVTVTSGSQIFVSVRLAGTYPDVLCPVTCEPKDSTRTFWSNADRPPYSWARLSSFPDIDGEFAVRLVGTTP